MPSVAQTDSLTSFQRNTKEHLQKLRRTGKPEVLTVKGEPKVVVQDAAAYEAMMLHLDELEAVTGIQRGIESAKQGKGRPVRGFMAEMRRKHSIPEPA